MVRVEVAELQLRPRKFENKKGKPVIVQEQDAYAFIVGEDGKPAKYPVKFTLLAQEERGDDGGSKWTPYPVGFYVLHPACLQVGQYNKLEIQRPRLIAERPSK